MNTRPIHIKLVSGQPVIRHQRRFVCARFQAGHLNRLVNRRISSSKSPQENTGGESGEKEISIRDVLEEAAALGKDFVFEDDDSDDKIWDLEVRIAGPPSQSTDDPPKIRAALKPEEVDILSAYSPEQGFQELTVVELRARQDDGPFLVLDVREQTEFEEGHIPGARNISMTVLSERVRAGALDDFKNGPLAVVCATGKRSAQAAVRLQRVLGFTGVVNVRGGIEAWREAGYPVYRHPEGDRSSG